VADRLTFMQRRALRGMVKQAHKHPGEPLTEDDWEAYFRFLAQPSTRTMRRLLRSLPSTPRCGYCGAPFSGVGARIVRPFGYRPSRKNPNLCASCVETAPPGGITVELGVLFADVRGFTSTSETISPAEASVRLRRFYAHAEKVLFPEALIDKLIGDEVMALYIPMLHPGQDTPRHTDRQLATLMVEHAHELLHRIGYGTGAGPEFEVGIGLDFGEAFVGNIGDTAVHDFTAVGDVVNTASRLQGHAAGGEVLLTDRLVHLLDEPLGEPDRLELKGKQDPVDVRRIRWFAD
jgi:adenylate cyclase